MKTALFVKEDGSLGATQRTTADMQRTVAEAVSTLDNIPELETVQKGGRKRNKSGSKPSLIEKLLGLTGKTRKTLKERKRRTMQKTRNIIRKDRKSTRKNRTRNNKKRVVKKTRKNNKLRR